MKGEKGFDDAQGDMKEAEGDLKGEGQGQGGKASQATAAAGSTIRAEPARAAPSTRRAARSKRCARARRACSSRPRATARAAARLQGDEPAAGRRRPGRDPLGRESGNRGGALEGALHGGADVAERARQVLEELRRRLADPSRPEEERDYFERLLKRD